MNRPQLRPNPRAHRHRTAQTAVCQPPQTFQFDALHHRPTHADPEPMDTLKRKAAGEEASQKKAALPVHMDMVEAEGEDDVPYSCSLHVLYCEQPNESIMEASWKMCLIDKLQDSGINAADLKKLKDAGYNTSQSVAFTMRKELLSIKGLSDQKVDKIIEAARKTSEVGFITCSQLVSKMKNRFQIATGAGKFDQMLGGGIESCSITEVFGEFRCGKTQLCHSLSVMAQLPNNMGGANGKVVYIDTEGTFRPERLRQIAEAKGVSAEAAMENIIYARCYTSDHLEHLLQEAASLMVNDEDRFALLVVDSIMGGFRVDYSGRGELADRQQKLARVMNKLQKVSEEFNVAVLLSNQVMADPGGGCAFMPSYPKPVGGHILAHFSTTRVMLRKGRGDQRVAKIYDSPCLPESESVFEIYNGGVRNGGD
ncbi:unnamed protein product [Durusdinium trenchii]|uniref:Meiotic recombination protein DMC1 n=3 Tax=Durusdinium trenchii TaxID=1381693 RepID=A0ABP0HV98_9DINO